jgi:DNA-binding Lrp family transcriptional regulator
MATQAYAFIHATPGRVEEVGKAIAEIEGVKSAHACWGRPDVIVFVEVLDSKALCQIVLQRIQRAPAGGATDARILDEM